MKNLNLLFAHEMHQQFKSFKFITMLMLAFIVSLSVSYIRINNYKEKYSTYLDEVKRSEEKLKKVQVYSELEVAVFVPPTPLSIFSKGVVDKVGNKIIVSATHYPGIQSTSQKANPFLNIFSEIDIVGVVRLFSIFIILMTAGVIAGEREDKTLRMVFVNNVQRGEYFLAKYFAISFVVFCSIIIEFIIPTLMMLLDDEIATDFNFFRGIVLLLGASFLYLSVFVLLSLLVSIRSASSSQSILVTLFLWLGIVFIYPQIISSLVSYIHILPSKTQLIIDINEIDRSTLKSNADYFIEHLPKDRILITNSNEGYNLDGGRVSIDLLLKKIDLADKFTFEFYRKMQEDKVLPNLMVRHQEVQFLENKYRKDLVKQTSLFNTLTFFIPDISYNELCKRLAQTNYEWREERFRQAAYSYRELLINYIYSKGGYGYKFFTQIPEERMREKFNSYTQKERDVFTNMKYLEMADLPMFYITNKLSFPLNGFIYLLIVNMLLLLLGRVIFVQSKIL